MGVFRKIHRYIRRPIVITGVYVPAGYLYKTGVIGTSITDEGIEITILMRRDE